MARITIPQPGFRVPYLEAPPVAQQGSVAAAAQQATEKVVVALDRKQREDASMSAAYKLAATRRKFSERLIQAQANGEIDEGFTASLDSEFQDHSGEMLAEVEHNQYETALLTSGLLSFQGELTNRAMGFEAEAAGQKRYSQLIGTVNEHKATVFSDPSQFARAQEEVMAARRAFRGTPEQQAAADREVQGLGEHALRGIAERDPAQAIKLIDSGEAARFGTDADRLPIIRNSAQAELDRRENKGKQQRSESEQTAYLQKLWEVKRYGDGAGPRPEITPDTANLVGADNAIRLGMQLDAEEAALRKARAGIDLITTSLSNGIPLDPGDAKTRGYVDDYWKAVGAPAIAQSVQQAVSGMRELQVDQGEIATQALRVRNDGMMTMFQSLNMVPDSVKGQIRAQLRGGSPDEQVQAADLYSRIVQEMPLMASDFNADDVRLATLINQRRTDGLAPQEAVVAATDAIRKGATQSAAERQGVVARYNDLNKSSSPGEPNQNEKWLASKFDEGWFSSSPAVRVNMAAKFDDAVRREFEVNGNDIDAARRAAFDKFQNVAGVTRVNGKTEVMREAPELFYKVPGFSAEQNAQWIRQQAQDEASAGAFNAPEIRGNVKILPFPDTTSQNRRAPDGRPVYMLVIDIPGQPPQTVGKVGKDGAFRPSAWVPDERAALKPVLDEQAKRKKAAIDKAREEREGRRGFKPLSPPETPRPWNAVPPR
jgi:hypothetical protein